MNKEELKKLLLDKYGAQRYGGHLKAYCDVSDIEDGDMPDGYIFLFAVRLRMSEQLFDDDPIRAIQVLNERTLEKVRAVLEKQEIELKEIKDKYDADNS